MEGSHWQILRSEFSYHPPSFLLSLASHTSDRESNHSLCLLVIKNIFAWYFQKVFLIQRTICLLRAERSEGACAEHSEAPSTVAHGTRDEPARPDPARLWRSLTAYISGSIEYRDLKYWHNIDSSLKIVQSNLKHIFDSFEIMCFSES